VQLRNRARLSVEATQGGTAGSLRLTANQVTIDSGAIASVSSPQGQAGNLIVNANTVRLNQGQLAAETGTSRTGRTTAGDRVEPNGALIQLQDLEQLVMRNNSLVSARATDRANGGNIQTMPLLDLSLLFLLKIATLLPVLSKATADKLASLLKAYLG
jgi:large exoprotein involved in heme utilization and adhesion